MMESVRAYDGETMGDSNGYEGNKKVKGIKRHINVIEAAENVK